MYLECHTLKRCSPDAIKYFEFYFLKIQNISACFEKGVFRNLENPWTFGEQEVETHFPEIVNENEVLEYLMDYRNEVQINCHSFWCSVWLHAKFLAQVLYQFFRIEANAKSNVHMCGKISGVQQRRMKGKNQILYFVTVETIFQIEF